MSVECSFPVRETTAEDADAILAISRGVGVFSQEEIDTVEELLTDYFRDGPERSGYHFLSCLDDGRVVGFSCHGPRALTEGTYDLYWIATDPHEGRRGIAACLLVHVRDVVRARGGRLLIAETSSRGDYEKTRRFYERQGYHLEASIADFYSPGDDILMFVDRL